MNTEDLAGSIEAALTEALSGAGFRLVTGVDMRQGWGNTLIVTVHTRLARADASPSFRRVIEGAVADVLAARRHYVEVRWEGI